MARCGSVCAAARAHDVAPMASGSPSVASPFPGLPDPPTAGWHSRMRIRQPYCTVLVRVCQVGEHGFLPCGRTNACKSLETQQLWLAKRRQESITIGSLFFRRWFNLSETDGYVWTTSLEVNHHPFRWCRSTIMAGWSGSTLARRGGRCCTGRGANGRRCRMSGRCGTRWFYPPGVQWGANGVFDDSYACRFDGVAAWLAGRAGLESRTAGCPPADMPQLFPPHFVDFRFRDRPCYRSE